MAVRDVTRSCAESGCPSLSVLKMVTPAPNNAGNCASIATGNASGGTKQKTSPPGYGIGLPR